MQRAQRCQCGGMMRCLPRAPESPKVAYRSLSGVDVGRMDRMWQCGDVSGEAKWQRGETEMEMKMVVAVVAADAKYIRARTRNTRIMCLGLIDDDQTETLARERLGTARVMFPVPAKKDGLKIARPDKFDSNSLRTTKLRLLCALCSVLCTIMHYAPRSLGSLPSQCVITKAPV